jgi:hypothetical protein
MEKKEAIKVLHYFQKWRRGANITMPDPKQVGLAIDVAISVLRESIKQQTNELRN